MSSDDDVGQPLAKSEFGMRVQQNNASLSEKIAGASARMSMVAPHSDTRRSRQSVAGGEEDSEEEVDDGLTPVQRCTTRILVNPVYQFLMTLIILSHMVLSMYETDQHAADEARQPWQEVCEKMFMAIYVIDIGLRMFTLRAIFFSLKMNIFDLFIVIVDVGFGLFALMLPETAEVGPISLLRGLRALRIVRVIRNFAEFRELYLMMKGMAGALRAIFFATLLILGVLTIFSIVAVEMIHPLNKRLASEGKYPNCSRCHRAFSSVMASNLTFFSSIIGGDSWGRLSIPLLETAPWTGLVILCAFIVVELGLLNVIVAVVVDRQAQAREEDKALQFTMKEEIAKASYRELISLFKTMDADGGGSLTVDELITSFDKHAEFRQILQVVDITRDELPTIFNSMDRDGGGSIDYEEFVQELHSLRTLDMRTLLYLTRQHVLDTKRSVQDIATKLLRYDHCFESLGAPPMPCEEEEAYLSAHDPFYVSKSHEALPEDEAAASGLEKACDHFTEVGVNGNAEADFSGEHSLKSDALKDAINFRATSAENLKHLEKTFQKLQAIASEAVLQCHRWSRSDSVHGHGSENSLSLAPGKLHSAGQVSTGIAVMPPTPTSMPGMDFLGGIPTSSCHDNMSEESFSATQPPDGLTTLAGQSAYPERWSAKTQTL